MIAGMMMPLTNWAPKLASNSCAFFSRNRCATSCCRPNTLTSACPVKVSSICPLSSPVCAHCAANSGCERLAISAVITRVNGTVMSETTARIGEMTNIITITPMTVSSEVSSWLRVCCSVWAMLSTSLVTRLSTSPRCTRSK